MKRINGNAERRRRENQGAEGVGCGEGRGCRVPLRTEGEGWGGAVPPPQKKFLILALNMVSFGAFWTVFFYSSATCFTSKTRVQQAYKSRDVEYRQWRI